MDQKAAVLLVILAVAALAVPLAFAFNVPVVTTSPGLKKFSSYVDLLDFVQAGSNTAQSWAKGGVVFMTGTVPAMAPTSSMAGALDASTAARYSETNIQVAGVDEADIVKTDGSYIYLVRGNQYGRANEVDIIQAYPVASARVVSRLNWSEGKSASELLIDGSRMVVFLSSYGYGLFMPSTYSPKAEMYVYDISNRANPVLVRNITIDGSYFDSRLIGDYVYAITTSYAYVANGQVALPTLTSGSAVHKVQASDVFYSDTADQSYAFTTLISFNIKEDLATYSSKTILTGTASVLYVSASNVYLAITEYGSPVKAATGGIMPMIAFPSSQDTLIYRVKIQNGDMIADAQGSVPGFLLNQFSLDEHDGFLRVATTSGSPFGSMNQSNNVYILDGTLAIAGKVEGMAPGEKIYSARFVGDRAYIVTFKKVDPLFVVSLSDPYNPKVLGWLTTPGFSDYLQPIDANHVLGIGKDAADSKTGDFAWYQGLKVSVFDVTNVTAPAEVAKFVIGDRGSDSPVLSDHKALLYDPASGLMVLPVTVAKVNTAQYGGQVPVNAYGTPVWQGAYVFSVSAASLTLSGTVTQIPGGLKGDSSEYNLYIQRSLYIGSYLYTVSNGMVKVNSLPGLGEVTSIALP